MASPFTGWGCFIFLLLTFATGTRQGDMSIVSEHAFAAANQSFSMIGAEIVTLGSDTISCVLAEADTGKNYEETGYKDVLSLTAVCRTVDLPAASIDKRAATARGVSYRVEGLSKGGTFTRFTLESPNKA